MSKLKLQFINPILVALAFIEGLWAYSRLPEKVASHWNAQGQVDAYSSKSSGAFTMPIIILVVYLLLLVLPKIDPKRKVAGIIGIFNLFITVFLLFMIYIYNLTIAYNIKGEFDFLKAMLPALGIFFYFIGWMLPQAKPNWFIGIRTPWTLSSDKVWEKSHELGGKLFKASGILILLGFLFPRHAIYFVFVPVIASALYTTIYSYFEYNKEKK